MLVRMFGNGGRCRLLSACFQACWHPKDAGLVFLSTATMTQLHPVVICRQATHCQEVMRLWNRAWSTLQMGLLPLGY